MTQQELQIEFHLIGFAGSPWTLLCYAVQGQGSKTFDKAKHFVLVNLKQHIIYFKKLQIQPLLILKKK